ncbi:hypothetical protein DL93DRAFT_2082471 [Clavulina sp. PMI_390]|nr:hypothetical protein DL93DRAFT_2082471 [Clavulina sp. PMI_390]
MSPRTLVSLVEKDEKNRSLLIKKIDEYLNRAEKLKEYLAKEEKPNLPGVSGGNGTPTSGVAGDVKGGGDEATGATPQSVHNDSQPPFTTTPQTTEQSPEAKALIARKTDEYMTRAEKLKKYLAKGENSNSGGQPLSHTSTSQTNFLDRGITYSEIAVEADLNHNYQEAYKHYMDSLDCLLLAHKYETNPRVKTLIAKKTEEYMGRAEKLKGYLAKAADSDSGGAPTEGGGATSSIGG